MNEQAKITVAVWAEHTTMAGYECAEWDGEESDDLVIYEGTPDELREIAAAHRANHGLYSRRLAVTLAEACE